MRAEAVRNVGWLDLNGAGRVDDGLTVAGIAVLAVLLVTELVRAGAAPQLVALRDDAVALPAQTKFGASL